jgi:hypothetical protein
MTSVLAFFPGESQMPLGMVACFCYGTFIL